VTCIESPVREKEQVEKYGVKSHRLIKEIKRKIMKA